MFVYLSQAGLSPSSGMFDFSFASNYLYDVVIICLRFLSCKIQENIFPSSAASYETEFM